MTNNTTQQQAQYAPVRLFDTARGEVAPVRLRTPGEVSMYVCGPTVYAAPHLGHGRFALVFDVLRRYLEARGMVVTYVSNITDVDDKILRRADEEGRSPAEVTAQYEQVWYETLDRLGVQRPTVDPHATEYIPQMVALVGELLERGAAYVLPDGVYLEVSRVPGHGRLARQDLTEMRAGARVEVRSRKRAAADFALWKLVDDDSLSWPSPWGRGRPGWHTECVAMSLDILGEGFDIHGGGLDLAFPHHEDERAQAVMLGKQFAQHWVHNGFVVDSDGAKLSKSEGNFDPVESYLDLVELLDDADPRSYRLLVLQGHYRSPLTVTRKTVAAAGRTLETIDAIARRAASHPETGADAELLARFHAEMEDDLATHRGLAHLFDGIRDANAAYDRGEVQKGSALARAVLEALEAVGIRPREGEDLSGRAEELAQERDAARAAKEWARADELREELRGLGWKVEDTPEGTRIHR